MCNLKYKDSLENPRQVRVTAICEMKEKWIIILDPAGGSLLVGISLGVHHLVNPTECGTSFSL
jgi:hypothetical protein